MSKEISHEMKIFVHIRTMTTCTQYTVSQVTHDAQQSHGLQFCERKEQKKNFIRTLCSNNEGIFELN